MFSCVISFFYIKPQRSSPTQSMARCCVISFFYIKPQLRGWKPWYCYCCVISFFYIKPQQITSLFATLSSCVISFFYIKPQLHSAMDGETVVVLYLSSTSNHNLDGFSFAGKSLCYIFLLHQTTTVKYANRLHEGCVISFFYIKPQLLNRNFVQINVVLYLSSTSNHNDYQHRLFRFYVVLYLSSTSNHNLWSILATNLWLCYIFLLHQTTTSLHWANSRALLCYIFLLHQTTTLLDVIWMYLVLCYIFLLHQTTTQRHAG